MTIAVNCEDACRGCEIYAHVLQKNITVSVSILTRVSFESVVLKAKTRVITLTNHEGYRQSSEPTTDNLVTQSKTQSKHV